MSDFQDFLDNNLANIKLPQTSEPTMFEDYDIFAEVRRQISDIRSKENLTQKELARKCGLTQANISNIEKGIAKPTIETLKKIADATGKRIRIEFVEREEMF